MKQVSNLFDALRNEKFAIAVKDDHGTRYYGVDGNGREWAQWANAVDTKSIESSQLPAGIIQGPFKNTTDFSLKSLINSLGYSEPTQQSYIASKAYAFKSSHHVPNGARVPAVMDTPISYFTTNQYGSAINYKALAMRTQVKESSFLFEARANNYAFNFENCMYNAQPSKAEIKSLRQRIDNHVGRSSERRLGLKLKNAILDSSSRTKTGVIHELETKSLQDSMDTKGIGQRIGGAARLGRRAAANFDPKAWDGDGDGLVQEGTPFQRPAIPGVNDISTGGRVDVRKARKQFNRVIADAPRRSVRSSKPSKRVFTGLASTSKPEDASKQITDKAKDVLRNTDSSSSFKKLVTSLGPNGEGKITSEQESRIKNHIKDYDSGLYEDKEDFLSDISNVLSGRPSGKKPTQGGMRSRISTAQTQRQVDGLASRSSRAKSKSKSKGIPGKDKVDEKDGQLWESLTPEQKDTVKKQAETAYEDLMDDIRQKDSYWWNDFVNQVLLSKKDKDKFDVDGKPWDRAKSRIAGEAYTSYQLMMEDTLADARRQLSQLESQLPSLDPDAAKKVQNKINRLNKEVEKSEKLLDDLRTFDQMKKSDDWSLLEHLHPDTRQKIFGKKVPKADKEKYEDVFAGTKSPLPLNEESTIFGAGGGFKKEKSIIGEKGDKKLAELARKITAPNPERARRRAVRKQKKAGRSGFNIEEENRPKGQGRIKRRINKAKRSIKRTFGKERNDSKILDGIRSGQTTRIFERDADGKVILGAETVDGLDKIFNEAVKANGRGEFKGQDGANMLLGYLWENNGFNREATLISEDEAIGLMDAGWFAIKRGVQRENYSEEYLTSPIRRITGNGGELEGVGEYWAHADSKNWNSSQYWGNENEPNGIFGFVSPDYKVATNKDRIKFGAEHSKISDVVRNTVKIWEDGEAEKMEPKDFVRELNSMLAKAFADGDPIWSGEVGQMWSSLISAYESADGAEKAKLWNIINFMSTKLMKQDNWQNYIPLILGYDAIDTGEDSARLGGNNKGKQFLVFNRQGLAVLDRPINVAGIDAILEKADKK